MNKMRIATLTGVALLSLSLSACSIFHRGESGHKHVTSLQKYKEARAGNNPERLVIQSRDNNNFVIYMGSLTAKKGKKNQGQTLDVAGKTYHTSNLNIPLHEIKRPFVAKTNDGKPALALRLKPEAVSKLQQARKQGYTVILASLNNSVFSEVNGAGANLADGVLLFPMPTLVSARDAADALR
ncbi:hypothetical protein [Brackiella oedipodis]|uniref:hypothetical protein n=1 Tax=Brackiella oedipodis TaxID=124225 RepID=UPI00049119B4|nr:hypothetical protein [Brackiella oedipodis]